MTITLLKRAALFALLALAWAGPALADSEAGNRVHSVTGPYGKCLAISSPKHDFDPMEGPRQEGRTEIRKIGAAGAAPVRVYDWYADQLFVLCPPEGPELVVRLGPWQRGHNPSDEHLALAFYAGGELLKRYSTLDIAGGEKSAPGAVSDFKNITPTVSHYVVFSVQPQLAKQGEDWVIEAITVDGRELVFDVETGELL
ncbi:MAG: hypothetical protein AAF495_07715 [Pseudomonadota bacterium]